MMFIFMKIAVTLGVLLASSTRCISTARSKPMIRIVYDPPLFQLDLPSRDKQIKSVEFRYGIDNARQFSVKGKLQDGTWTYRNTNGSVVSKHSIWAYALLYDESGRPKYKSWYTSIYAGSQLSPAVSRRSSSNLPSRRMAGAVIFREDFNQLDKKIWFHYNGVNFKSFEANVPDERITYVRDGKLYIKPMLTVDHPAFDASSLTSGKMDLNALYNKCHMYWTRGGCVRQGTNQKILPPVMSARIHSRPVLRYGIVEVRARIPLGDWLHPAIWLRPRGSPYGGWPRDGEIDMMESRGNKGSWDVGLVRSAVHWGTSGSDRVQVNGRKSGRSWHTDFHVYKLEWTPDYIAMYVDNKRMMYLDPGESMYKRGNLKGPNIYANGKKIAPFDQDFFMIFNVAVGGGRTFLDSRSYGSTKKPWRNNAPTAAKDFWEGRSDWLPTWKGENAALVIDWVEFRNF